MSLPRILLAISALIAVGILAFAGWAWRFAIPPIQPPTASGFDRALVAKGAEFVAVGNCALCHTNSGGRPFTGGLPIPTPFGAIYSTNITPDSQSGIGEWSEAAFRRAMREGVARDGHYLYPAFPYNHFTKLTETDLDAIYAFLMTREPLRAENPLNKLPFPLNLRPIVAGWQLLFLERGTFQPDLSKDRGVEPRRLPRRRSRPLRVLPHPAQPFRGRGDAARPRRR
jgi:mono/diheme cytochrome c family protein